MGASIGKTRVYSSNSRCDRQRGIFALRKTFFCRNTDVFQGKMTRRTAKRPAVRVRWELEEYTLDELEEIFALYAAQPCFWRRTSAGTEASRSGRGMSTTL